MTDAAFGFNEENALAAQFVGEELFDEVDAEDGEEIDAEEESEENDADTAQQQSDATLTPASTTENQAQTSTETVTAPMNKTLMDEIAKVKADMCGNWNVNDAKGRRTDIPHNIMMRVVEVWRLYTAGTSKAEKKAKRECLAWCRAAIYVIGRQLFTIQRIEQVERWAKCEDDGTITRDTRRMRRTIKQGRRSMYGELETCVQVHVGSVRELRGRVTVTSTLEWTAKFLKTQKGSELAVNSTKINDEWIRRVLQRMGWRKKAVKRKTAKLPDDIKAAAQCLHTCIYRNILTGNVPLLLQFDEVPMSMSGSMGSLFTYTHKDDKEVAVSFDPSDMKRCATVIFTVAVIGSDTASARPLLVPPHILLKGDPPADSVLRHERYDSRVRVGWTPKAVVNGNYMHQVFVPFLGRQVRTAVPGGTAIAIFDSCGSHLTSAVMNALKARSIQPITIKAGFTSYLQFIDTHYTATYRRNHMRLYHAVTPLCTKRTMREKRALLARITGEAHQITLSQVDVVKAFGELGYLNPTSAKLRLPPEVAPYRFQVPVLTTAEAAEDKRRGEVARAAAKAAEEATKRALTAAKRGVTPTMDGFLRKIAKPTQEEGGPCASAL